MRFSRFAALAVVILGSLLTLNSAHAAFKLELTDTSCGTVGGAASVCNVYVQDNGAGDLLPLTSGSMIVATAVGTNFTTNIVTTQSKPVIGPGQLNLTSFDIAATSAGTLVLRLTDTSFAGPIGLASLVNRLTLNSLTGNSTVSSIGYESNTNGEFALGANNTGNVALTVAPTGITGTGGPFTLTNPYSLTEVITIAFTGACNSTTHPCNASLTKNLSVAPVPEPASVALFGAFLMLTAGAIRRRQKKNQSA